MPNCQHCSTTDDERMHLMGPPTKVATAGHRLSPCRVISLTRVDEECSRLIVPTTHVFVRLGDYHAEIKGQLTVWASKPCLPHAPLTLAPLASVTPETLKGHVNTWRHRFPPISLYRLLGFSASHVVHSFVYRWPAEKLKYYMKCENMSQLQNAFIRGLTFPITMCLLYSNHKW